jgi:hypothetical protein
MAKALSGNPTWPSASSHHVTEIAKEFKHDVRAIAEAMAKHEGAESVLVRHVDEAFSALSALGLRRRRWHSRPELLTSAGVALLGLAFSVPDVLDVFIDRSEYPILYPSLRVGSVTCLFAGGLTLWLIGWLRGTRPATR